MNKVTTASYLAQEQNQNDPLVIFVNAHKETDWSPDTIKKFLDVVKNAKSLP